MDNDDDDGTLKMNIMCKLYVASDAIFFVFASSVSVLLLLLLLVLLLLMLILLVCFTYLVSLSIVLQ